MNVTLFSDSSLQVILTLFVSMQLSVRCVSYREINHFTTVAVVSTIKGKVKVVPVH